MANISNRCTVCINLAPVTCHHSHSNNNHTHTHTHTHTHLHRSLPRAHFQPSEKQSNSELNGSFSQPHAVLQGDLERYARPAMGDGGAGASVKTRTSSLVVGLDHRVLLPVHLLQLLPPNKATGHSPLSPVTVHLLQSQSIFSSNSPPSPVTVHLLHSPPSLVPDTQQSYRS